MTSLRLIASAALVVASVFSLHAQGNVTPPGTGTSTYTDPPSGIMFDTNWYITYNSLIGEPQNSTYSTGEIVTNPSTGWYKPSGGTWIAPAADQTNGTRPGTCCQGSTTYQLQFPVNSLSEAFVMTVAADDSLVATFNGSPITFSGTANYAGPVTATFTKGFINGTNTFSFSVTNVNGPTGLYVSFAPVSSTTPPPTQLTLGATTQPASYSLLSTDDPVDSASGQFYETDSDIQLGGPMRLGFSRYYSSQLSNGNVSSALGTNWMSNFDAVAIITGANVQVLLFGGKIVSFTNSSGVYQLTSPKDIPYQFIQNVQKFQFMDPSSRRVYTFTTPGVLAASIVGTLTSIADQNGNTIAITQGTSGPTQISDGLGRTLALTYTNGQLTQVTDQAARTVSFTYSGGLLASATDIYKQTTTYAYSTVGSATALMTHKQLPLGNIPASQTFDGQGRVLTQRVVPGNDGNAYTTTMSYDGNGGTTITDGLGNVTKHVSDGTGDILQATNPAGGTAIVTYDGSNRRTSITDKLGNKTSYAYDPQSGLLSSITDALGNTTSISYVAQPKGGFTFYYLAGVSYPDGTSVGRTYDSSGNVLTKTGQKGTITKYAYDTSGRPIAITAPNQQTSTLTWNSDSTMASSTDALGNKQTFGYDNTKRMTSKVDPNGGTTGYVRDKSITGPMLAIIPPVTRESTTIDDDQNRELARVVISTGGVFTSGYSATGQLSSYADPLNNTTNYTYDGDDRMSTITSPAGEVVSYVWDSANRVTSISDLSGLRTSYTYTAENKIATATDGSGRKASYAYDAMGRLQAITTPGGNTYKAGYDKLGNTASRTNPLGEIETLTRDAAGAVVSATMAGAITTSLARDTAGRVTAMTTPNGNTWTIGYDALERPAKSTDPLGNSTTFSYTGAHITGATLPLGTVAVTDDADGRVTQRKFSDGTTINTAYDTNGKVISSDGVTIARDAAMRPTNINGIGITLDVDNRLASLTYASGKAVTYAYDKSGRLASVSDWVGGKTTLAYDGAGRLTSLTYPNGIATAYTYDPDGRVLTVAAGSLTSIALTRDVAGKITSANRNVPRTPVLQNGTQQFAYDPASQLTSATSDAMGRVTAQSGRKYTWNLASQLTSFSDGTSSGTFTYDGLGEMSSSTASGAAQTFVFNYLLRFPALSIVRQGGSDLRYYVYLPSGVLLYSIEAADNTRHFFHFDEMGNTVMLTADSGVMTDSYAVTPYGENADHVGTTSNPFTWQGKYGVMQEGQGLYYARSRHYDASAARFVSRDPFTTGDPRSSEPYIYARGNPLKYVDPLGNLSTDDLQDAQSFLAAIALSAALTGLPVDVNDAQALLLSAINTPACSNSCAYEGWELVEFIGNNNDLNFNDLYALLTPPAPPPPPDPPAPTFVIGSSPMPVQLGPPVAAQSTLPCVGAGSGGAAASPTGIAPLPLPALLASIPQFTFDASGNLISQDGGGVVSNDGGSLISQDGGGILARPGDPVLVNGLAYVVSNDGGSLISQDGGGLIPVSSTASIISDNSEGLLGGINNLFLNSSSLYSTGGAYGGFFKPFS